MPPSVVGKTKNGRLSFDRPPSTQFKVGVATARTRRSLLIAGVTNYFGIDPGGSGGLAVLTAAGSATATTSSAVTMPATERDVWEWVENCTPHDGSNVFAVIEKVGGYAGDRASGGNGPAMFKFGMSYGGLRMALVAAGIPFDEVTPQTWQKGLGIAPRRPHTKTREVQIKKGKNKGKWRTERYGGETDTEFKNRLKAKAQQLFPTVKVTLAVADALLIAEYCRRKREGKL